MTWYSNSEGRHGKLGAKGDKGERIVMERLKEMGLNATNPQDYNSQVHEGIDVIVEGVKANVKSNIWLTNDGNHMHFVECINSKGGPGWIHNPKYKAECIFAVCEKDKKVYSYRVEDMRKHVKKKEVDTDMKSTNNGGKGYWVPLNYYDRFVDDMDDDISYSLGKDEDEIVDDKKTNILNVFDNMMKKDEVKVKSKEPLVLCDCMFGCSVCNPAPTHCESPDPADWY